MTISNDYQLTIPNSLLIKVPENQDISSYLLRCLDLGLTILNQSMISNFTDLIDTKCENIVKKLDYTSKAVEKSLKNHSEKTILEASKTVRNELEKFKSFMDEEQENSFSNFIVSKIEEGVSPTLECVESLVKEFGEKLITDLSRKKGDSVIKGKTFEHSTLVFLQNYIGFTGTVIDSSEVVGHSNRCKKGDILINFNNDLGDVVVELKNTPNGYTWKKGTSNYWVTLMEETIKNRGCDFGLMIIHPSYKKNNSTLNVDEKCILCYLDVENSNDQELMKFLIEFVKLKIKLNEKKANISEFVLHEKLNSDIQELNKQIDGFAAIKNTFEQINKSATEGHSNLVKLEQQLRNRIISIMSLITVNN